MARPEPLRKIDDKVRGWEGERTGGRERSFCLVESEGGREGGFRRERYPFSLSDVRNNKIIEKS
jgi:hypothetical protein